MFLRNKKLGGRTSLLLLGLFSVSLAASALEPGDAAGLERFKSFDTAITVMTDGSIIVRETAAVHAEGIEIKHGLYRQFPTHTLNNKGIPFKTGLQILEVLVNGEKAPYFLEDNENSKKIYIGRADTLIPPGDYTYVLAYRMENQLGHYIDHDELTWSIGNWSLQIDMLTARVALLGASADDIYKVDAWIEGVVGGNIQTTVRTDGVVDIAFMEVLLPGGRLRFRISWRRKDVEVPGHEECLGTAFHPSPLAIRGHGQALHGAGLSTGACRPSSVLFNGNM